MEFWSDKNIDDIVTTKVVSVDKKGLIVKPKDHKLRCLSKIK